MSILISREDAKRAVLDELTNDVTLKEIRERPLVAISMAVVKALNALPSAEVEWIPVEWHYITDEEREENGYPKDWGVLMDCDMPLDEQEILVTTTRGRVEKDVCYLDGEFSLDSGWDWVDDILAWMPLPEPYREDGEV